MTQKTRWVLFTVGAVLILGLNLHRDLNLAGRNYDWQTAAVKDLYTSVLTVGVAEALKHDSAIHCDELVSLAKSVLTDYIGSLAASRISELDRALAVALELL